MELKIPKIDKAKFDYYWKIALMLILIVSIIYMFYEWKTIDKEAMTCKNNPFVWGARIIAPRYENSIDCNCYLGDGSIMRFNQTYYAITKQLDAFGNAIGDNFEVTYDKINNISIIPK